MKKIAGIDVHKKVLIVVIAEAASPEQIVRKDKFGTGRAELERLRVWLQQTEVGDVVMESTAQYWRPVWNELEPFFALHLAMLNPTALPKAASPTGPMQDGW
jgi:transposase